MSTDKVLSKDDIEFYLKELAKNIRKISGKYPPTEIIIVGGASILLNYNFRMITEDIDAVDPGNRSDLKMAINQVTDKYDLRNDWLNSDFTHTASYTPRLRQYSQFYKQYSNCVKIYTIKDEYLIAMKIVSARMYKNDLSDIVGILLESDRNITFESIDRAMNDLYDGWENVNSEVAEMVKELLNMSPENLRLAYSMFIADQEKNRNVLIDNEKNKTINDLEVKKDNFEIEM